MFKGRQKIIMMDRTNNKQQKIAKTITPLIVFCGFVILITIILVNFYSQKKVVRYEDEELNTPISLSPFTKRFKRRKYMRGSAHKSYKIPSNFSVNTKKLLREARMYLAAKKTAQAEDKLRTLLVFEPDNASALSLLGGILFYSGRYPEAEMMFRQLIKYHPERISAYNSLASILAKQKKVEEGISLVSKILKKHPHQSYIYINLASMYASIGNKEKAIENFQKAYRLMGTKILPISYDSIFDPIRNTPEFQQIVHECEKKVQHKVQKEKE